jgi:thiol:disulfide interchange protein DsbD
MPLRRLPLSLLFGALALAFATLAPAAAPKSHVQASLHAADTSVQPGKSITIALRLQHEPKWHTYWQNPGTGLPTTLKWQLPAGWIASEIQWPAPIVLVDRTGNVVGNGYEGETLLPITLTATSNAPAGPVQIGVQADWLECADICVPGGAKLALTLNVSPEPPAPDPTWGAKIRATLATLPRSDPAWKLSATRTGNRATLTLTPAQGARPDHTPTGLHFFNTHELVAYDQPQSVAPDGRGGFAISLPLVAEPPALDRLIGVVTAKNGWRADGTLPGLEVNVPLTGQAGSSGAAAAAQAAPASGASLPATLALALLGGLILNLMPCVFPVLGLKILGFVNQSGHQRSKIVAHGLVFTLGVLLSFWSLATVLALLRAGGDQLGWGFQLQSPAFVYGLAVLLLVFGLNMSGVFEFGLGATAVGSDLQQKSGYAGSFFTGVLATVVATPCSAPFLAPALGAALAVSTVESFAIFTAIALGLSAPYLLLSIFPQAVKVLPRPGAWMETFKQFMAFPLYATVGALIWVLAAQTSEDGFLFALLGLVVIALGVWMYGRWNAPGAKPARARFGVASLIVVGAFGLWLGWPRATAATASATNGGVTGITWEPWSPEAVAKLRAEGRTIYVDFTARWCATCQTNKKLVFSSGEVLRTFADKKIATLRADWTNKDPRITEELARYGRSAVPFNVIWAPGKTEPIVLPELLTPSLVLESLRSAETKSGAVVTTR